MPVDIADGVDVSIGEVTLAPESAQEDFLGCGAQGGVHGRSGALEELRIGGAILTDVPASFVDPERDPHLGPPGVDGMVGIEVMSRFNIAFDCGRSRIFLKPRALESSSQDVEGADWEVTQ